MKRVAPLAWLALVLLIPINALIAYELLSEKKDVLTVSFLKVGQGDAIFVESSTGFQMLIDGGPDRSVLRELPKEMGVLDRSIDVVVATHPDKDHIAGLPGIFERYKIGTYIEPGVVGDSSFVDSVNDSVTREGLEKVLARRGMRLHLGDGAYADILYPDRDVSTLETNTASIVMRVVYGETEFMLTGDAPSSVEEWVLDLDESLQSDVLKAGHHGSRTSTSELWVEAVKPTYVLVSAGKGNSYGHPHQEVTDIVQKSGAQLLTTMDRSVTFVTDGTALKVR